MPSKQLYKYSFSRTCTHTCHSTWWLVWASWALFPVYFYLRLQVETTVQYTVHSAQCTVHNTQCTVHITQYTVHSTQYTVHSTQYTVHSGRYTVHSTQYTLTHASVSYAIAIVSHLKLVPGFRACLIVIVIISCQFIFYHAYKQYA